MCLRPWLPFVAALATVGCSDLLGFGDIDVTIVDAGGGGAAQGGGGQGGDAIGGAGGVAVAWPRAYEGRASSFVATSFGYLLSGKTNLGRTDVGGGVLSGSMFVASFDTMGKHAASAGFGNGTSDVVNGVALRGDVPIAVGQFDSNIDSVGNNVSAAGLQDAFVASLDVSGQPQHIHPLGTMAGDRAVGVVTSSLNDATFLAEAGAPGMFAGDTFGGVGTTDMVVAAVSPMFGPMHAESWGSMGVSQSPAAIAIDRMRQLVVTGGMRGTLDIGPGPVTSEGGMDIFVMKLTPPGDVLWGRRWGKTLDQRANAIALDDGDRPIIGGHFEGDLDLDLPGAVVYSSQAGRDGFIAKLTLAGVPQWANPFHGDGDVSVTAIATFGSDIVACGTFDGTADFGHGEVEGTMPGDIDVFVVRFNGGGQLLDVVTGGGVGTQHAKELVIDSTGQVLMAGDLEGSLDLGAGIVEAVGSPSFFITPVDI